MDGTRTAHSMHREIPSHETSFCVTQEENDILSCKNKKPELLYCRHGRKSKPMYKPETISLGTSNAALIT
jgi:hypothetical protein